MNQEQMNAAMLDMSAWLSHPQELGHAPVKIECAGTFCLHEMQYYIFRYKAKRLGKWLLGVCGGYEGDSLEHCGHVFSEMEEYEAASAEEKAKEMVEAVRTYWMKQAEQAEQRKEKKGSFVGFVLLSDASWDKQQLIEDLKDKWGIVAEEEEDDERDDTLILFTGESKAVVCLMLMPIPDHEAEANAEHNYMWPRAVEAAKAHKAHIMVAVPGGEENILEHGKLYTKLLSACCRQKNAIGIYASGVVFEPRFYEGFADMIKEDELPIFNWIWFGLYTSDNGICGYTYGMDVFGKDEMEVLDTGAEPSEVRDFLASLVSYVLEYDVTLQDGETIGFSAEDKHAITRSQGVALPEQMTLKISYDPIS